MVQRLRRLLQGAWVVLSGVKSSVNIVSDYIGGLITPMHEPPSMAQG